MRFDLKFWVGDEEQQQPFPLNVRLDDEVSEGSDMMSGPIHLVVVP